MTIEEARLEADRLVAQANGAIVHDMNECLGSIYGFTMLYSELALPYCEVALKIMRAMIIRQAKIPPTDELRIELRKARKLMPR